LRFYCLSFFFFQAEDGIRDRNVTGVQTCALPILRVYDRFSNRTPVFSLTVSVLEALIPFTDEQLEQEYELPSGEKKKPIDMSRRSEERRVGKECRARRGTEQ